MDGLAKKDPVQKLSDAAREVLKAREDLSLAESHCNQADANKMNAKDRYEKAVREYKKLSELLLNDK